MPPTLTDPLLSHHYTHGTLLKGRRPPLLQLSSYPQQFTDTDTYLLDKKKRSGASFFRSLFFSSDINSSRLTTQQSPEPRGNARPTVLKHALAPPTPRAAERANGRPRRGLVRGLYPGGDRQGHLVVLRTSSSAFATVVYLHFKQPQTNMPPAQLTLGLTLGIPIALLIVFDFIFWVYRLAVPDRTKHTSTSVSSSRARRRTDAAAVSKAASSSSHRQHPLTAS